MSGGGGDPGGGKDPSEDRRAAWERVRAGGRLWFHVVVTAATMAVCVVGEALGNVVFRAGQGLEGKTIEAAAFGFLAGNLLALWLWVKQDAKR